VLEVFLNFILKVNKQGLKYPSMLGSATISVGIYEYNFL